MWLVVLLFATIARSQGQDSCHPLGGKTYKLKVDGSNEWVCSPNKGAIVATGSEDAAVPFYLRTADDCHMYTLQNKQLNDDDYFGVGECNRAHLSSSFDDAFPVQFHQLDTDKYSLNTTGENHLSFATVDIPDDCGLHPAFAVSANYSAAEATLFTLHEDQLPDSHQHTIQKGWTCGLDCASGCDTTLTCDVQVDGVLSPALFDGPGPSVPCPGDQCQNTLFVVRFNPWLTSGNIFNVNCIANGETNFFISQDGWTWEQNGTLVCNQQFTVYTRWRYLGIKFTDPSAQMIDCQFLDPSGSGTAGTPSGFLAPNPTALDTATALDSFCCLSYLEYWEPQCPEGQHSYYGSPRCSSQCDPNWDVREDMCVPLLNAFLGELGDPVVTLTQAVAGYIRISVSTPLTPRENYEDMSTYTQIDIQPAREALDVDSPCNPEFTYRDDIIDNGLGWKNSANGELVSQRTKVPPVGDINGWYTSDIVVEQTFQLPPQTPTRFTVRLLLKGALQQDMVYIIVNGIRAETVHQVNMCPADAVSGIHHSGCEYVVTFDLEGTPTGEYHFRIGSDTDGEWGHQNFQAHSPVMSADVSYVGFNATCVMRTEEDERSIIRTGWLRVITRGARNVNPLQFPDQTVGERDQHLTVRFSRWVTASVKPVTIWLTELGINATLNSTMMFSSVLTLFETAFYAVTKNMANYKFNETIFAQHALPMNDQDAVWSVRPGTQIDGLNVDVRQLYIEVKCVYLSLDWDPTNSSAIIHNFTISSQDSQSKGLVQFNFTANKACESTMERSCVLHVVSVVSTLPVRRRLQEVQGEPGEGRAQNVAVMSLPIEVQQGPRVVEPLPSLVTAEPLPSPNATAGLERDIKGGSAKNTRSNVLLGLMMAIRLLNL